MGIGNASAGAGIMRRMCDFPIQDWVGHGTGLNDAQLQHKISVPGRAPEHRHTVHQPLDVLQTFGACGAMLQAATLSMRVLVDSFIATVTF